MFMTNLPYIFVLMDLASECWLPVQAGSFVLAYVNVIKNLCNGVVQ